MSNKYDFIFRENFLNTDFLKISGFKIIDLSKNVTMETIVPGDSGYSDPCTIYEGIESVVPCRYDETVKIGQWVNLDIKRYHVTKIIMGAHAGTHVDAPMHAKYDGKSIDQIDQYLVGPCCLIDLNENLNESSLREILMRVKSNKTIIVLRGNSNYAIKSHFRELIISSKPKAVVFGECVNVGSIDDTVKYCENDIRVLMSYIQEKIEQDGDISKIPLTNTGYVRRYAREACFQELCEVSQDDREFDTIGF